MCLSRQREATQGKHHFCQHCYLAPGSSSKELREGFRAAVTFEIILILLTEALIVDSDLLVGDFCMRQNHVALSLYDSEYKLLLYSASMTRELEFSLSGCSLRPWIQISIGGDFYGSFFPSHTPPSSSCLGRAFTPFPTEAGGKSPSPSLFVSLLVPCQGKGTVAELRV